MEPKDAYDAILRVLKAKPRQCSRHGVRLVYVQRLNPRLEQIEGGRSDVKATVSGLVPESDTLSSLIIGTAYSPQHGVGSYVHDRSSYAVPFSSRPKAVIENNVEA